MPAAFAVALLASVGHALLAGDAPNTNATLGDPPSTNNLTPALIDITPDTAPADVPPATTAADVATTAAPVTTAPPSTVAPSTTTAPDDADGGTLPETPAEPIAPPADPRGAEEQIELGSISIPKLDVDAPLLEGIRLTTLDNGPGHWPGSAMPGEVGNVVVAAHRTSHGGPFRHIDQLVAGDTVEFTTTDGQSIYVVTGTQVVEPDAIWIVDPTDTPTATLFACHPPGSVSQRIVVNLELAT